MVKHLLIKEFLAFDHSLERSRFASSLSHPAFTYKWNVTFGLYKQVGFWKEVLYQSPCRYLICAASWQPGKRVLKRRQQPSTTEAHALSSSLTHMHRGEQDTEAHTQSGGIKGSHLTWSSTLWATIVAPSSCSASLRGRILKATCGTQSEFSQPLI